MKWHFACKLLVLGLLACPVQLALAQSDVGQIPGIPDFYVSDIAVNPITNRIYVTSSNPAEILVLDGRTNTIESTIYTGDTYAESVAVNPTTNRIYAGVTDNPGSVNNRLVVIDGSTGLILDRILVSQGGSGLVSVAVNPVTNRIYVADATNQRVVVIGGAADRSLKTVALGITPKSLAVNYSTNQIYVGVDSQAVPLLEIDGRTNRLSQPVSTGQPAVQVAVDVANNRVFILTSAPPAGAIYVMDGTGKRLIQVIPGFNYSIAVNPLTHRLWAVNVPAGSVAAGTVSLIDTGSNTVLSSLNLGDYNFGKIAVNPVTNTAYVLTDFGNVEVLSGQE